MPHIQILNFSGIESAKVSPPKEASTECQNFDLRGNSHELTTAHDYELRYALPTHPSMSNASVLGLTNMYIPDIGGGQEISVLVEKATLNGLNAPNSIPIIAVWTRPSWNGTTWVDTWEWINECYNTELSSQTNYTLEVADDTNLTANYYAGWYVTDRTTPPYNTERIVTSSNSAGASYLVVTNDNPNFTVGRDLLLSKSYIPYAFHSYMAVSASAADITFHKVLNDLRIGFGGNASTVALSLGFRNDYFRIGSIQDSSGIPYVSDLTALATFSQNYGIKLEVFNNLGMSGRVVTSASYAGGYDHSGNYSFYVDGVFDGFQEFTLGTSTTTVPTEPVNIVPQPQVKAGTVNDRLSALKVYYNLSNAASASYETNGLYLYLKEYPAKQSTFSATDWTIKGGYLCPNVPAPIPFAPTTNLIDEANAVTQSASDVNTTGSWQPYFVNTDKFGNKIVYPDLYCTLVSTGSSASLGTYSNYVSMDPGHPTLKTVGARIPLASLQANTFYNISMDIKTDADTAGLLEYGSDDTLNSNVVEANVASVTNTAWTTVSSSFSTYNSPSYFAMQVSMDVGSNSGFYFDNVSLTRVLATTESLSMTYNSPLTEMSAEIGYQPTSDYVASWDKAIVLKGRTFCLNPYDTSRHLNYIYNSNINGAGAFMYDVITADNYLTAENFDGNDCVNIDIYANNDIYLFRKNSIQLMDADTGQLRTLQFSDNIVSRRGIVNMGNRIYFPGKNDIYEIDGQVVRNLSLGTIRDSYRALTDAQKAAIFAVKDLNMDTYRAYIGGTDYVEYNYTPSIGWWFTERQVIPVGYSTTRDGVIQVITGNGIYQDSSTAYVPEAKWSSILFDVNLIEQAPKNARFYLRKLFIKYENADTLFLNLITPDQYGYDTIRSTIALIPERRYISKRLPLGLNAKNFKLQIQGDLLSGLNRIQSLGIEYDILSVGYRDEDR